MSLLALFIEHFWLLFALAVSIAVLRELRLDRAASTASRPPRSE